MKHKFTLFEKVVIAILIIIWGRSCKFDWEIYTLDKLREMIGMTPDLSDDIKRWDNE